MSQSTKFIFLTLAVLFLLISTYLVVVILIPNFQSQAGLEPGVAGIQSDTHASQNSARFISLIVVMMAGIVCSYIFEVAKKSGSTINIVAELTKMLSSTRFIMAIVVTPLIFNSIYLTIGINPQTVGDYLLAFQNGFFWETVMYGLSRDR